MIDNEFICPFCGSHNDPWFDRSFEIWTNPKTGEETHLGPFERCSDCGNDCKVPFKPIEGRPVYCRECFSKRKQF